jgi:hypothetical protein
MSNVRIDNYSNDMVTVFFDGVEYVIDEDEKIAVPGIEKGKHIIQVHRTRIPKETVNANEVNKADIKANIEKDDRSVHTQLDSMFEIEVNSSKTVVTVQQYAAAIEKHGINVLFSGYKLEAIGAKILSETKEFANESVKKSFVSYQLKNAFIPIGIGGIIIFLVGLLSVRAVLLGNAVNLGGTDISLPWAIGIAAVGIACLGYTIFVIIRTMVIAKKYSKIY